MFDDNEVMAQLSHAYLHAVAAHADCDYTVPATDRISVDATLTYCGLHESDVIFYHPKIDFQLKSTTQWKWVRLLVGRKSAMNHSQVLPEELYDKVLPTSMLRYIRAKGWRFSSHLSGRCYIYRLDNVARGEIVIPENVEFGDYTLRISEVVDTLSRIEKKPPIRILQDVLAASADVFRIRLADPAADDGSVSLLAGVSLYAGMTKTLMSSACDIVKRERFHKRISRKESEEYVKNCRFGQTERGSFIASIICPINVFASEDQAGQGNLFPEMPATDTFVRRVNSNLITSVNYAVQAIRTNKVETLINVEEGASIISANFFEGLSEIKASDVAGNLTIGIDWAPALPADTTVPTSVQLFSEDFTVFKQVSERLRPSNAPEFDVFVGRVTQLSGEEGKDNLMSGEVILTLIPQGSASLQAKVYLTPEDYLIACDAHKEARFITISGVLQRNKRLHQLLNYSNFDVIPSPYRKG